MIILHEYALDLNRMSERPMDSLRQTAAQFPDLVRRLRDAGCTVATDENQKFADLVPVTIYVGGSRDHASILEIMAAPSPIYVKTGRTLKLHNNGNGTRPITPGQ